MRQTIGAAAGAISRRRLLFLGAAGALGVAFGALSKRLPGRDPDAEQALTDPHAGHQTGAPQAPEAVETVDATVQGVTLMRWSDPATWKGKIPGPGDIASINLPVLLDVDAHVAGVVIAPSGSLIFDPARSRTVTSKGNVIVRGKLSLRPAKATVLHRLLITGADEAAFKGGHATPSNSDIGVWVVSNGVLDAIGAAKRGWLRASGDIGKGTKAITLSATPTGWRAGDEVVITPTRSPQVSTKHHDEYDTGTITSISGRTIKISRATGFPHPKVNVGGGKSFTAEVLNLTRNVRIEGKPGARTHVFLNSGRKQVIKYVAVRHVGPRQGGEGVLGRYGIHFHMVGNASRGSLVEGAVARDVGHHSFVPHASHGVTFRDCVAHNTMNPAFWWDPGAGNATRDALFDRCVSSLVHTDGAGEFRLSGFWLGHGEGNVARGCVAVGTRGSKNASGFQWPESPGPREDGTVWGFSDCVAHNNKVNGIFVWQNNSGRSVIDRFVAYHNGKAGIEHGAYKNVYQYTNSILYGNGVAGAIVWAVSAQVVPLSFRKVLFDGVGGSEHAVTLRHHNAPPSRTTRFESCTFRGYTKAAFGVLDQKAAHPDTVDVVGGSYSGNEFWLGNGIDPASVLRVKHATLGTLALRRADQAGTYYPQWNARVTTISDFA